MDSWNKETVQFKNADAAEEFMFYTENSAEVKKEYTVNWYASGQYGSLFNELPNLVLN